MSDDTAGDPYLWALDLDDGWPVRAHPVVRVEDDAPHRRYVTACGRTYREGRPGCWSTREPRLPLAEGGRCPDCGDTPPTRYPERSYA